MVRSLIFIGLMLSLVGCGPAVRSDPALVSTSVDLTESCLVLHEIEVESEPTLLESGVAVFVQVTSSNGSIGGTTRYPEEGVVWSYEVGTRRAMSPALCIPQQEDVTIEVMVIAVPSGMTEQGLNIVGYAFTEIVDTVLPGGKILHAIQGFLVDQATDATKAALQEGRLLGTITISAQQASQQSQLIADSGAFRISLARSSQPSLPPVNGMLITAVEPNSPAETAGLRVGWELVTLNEQPVQVVETARSIFNSHRGQKVLAVVRNINGQLQTLTIIPPARGPVGVDLCKAGRCSTPTTPSISGPTAAPASDIWIGDGMLVVDVDQSSVAAMAGFQKGQTLLTLNDQPIREVSMARNIFNSHRGEEVRAVIQEPDGQIRTLLVIPPAIGPVGIDLCESGRCPMPK